LEPEALAETQGERAARKPNFGHIDAARRSCGKLISLSFFAVIAFRRKPIYMPQTALYRKYGSPRWQLLKTLFRLAIPQQINNLAVRIMPGFGTSDAFLLSLSICHE